MMKWLLNTLGVVSLSLLLVAGCKSPQPETIGASRVKETRERITTAIEDPAKAEKLLAVLDAYYADLENIEKQVVALREEILTKNRDYHTSRSELEALYDQLNEQVALLGEGLKTRHTELRALCTSKEWAAIADFKQDLVDFKL